MMTLVMPPPVAVSVSVEDVKGAFPDATRVMFSAVPLVPGAKLRVTPGDNPVKVK